MVSRWGIGIIVAIGLSYIGIADSRDYWPFSPDKSPPPIVAESRSQPDEFVKMTVEPTVSVTSIVNPKWPVVFEMECYSVDKDSAQISMRLEGIHIDQLGYAEADITIIDSRQDRLSSNFNLLGWHLSDASTGNKHDYSKFNEFPSRQVYVASGIPESGKVEFDSRFLLFTDRITLVAHPFEPISIDLLNGDCSTK